jgi:predicted RNA-binding Zn-ribbon protein involved in translation (DUF1610 family)
MAIKFDCPACGKTTQAPDEMAGRKARCPLCKAVIEVPSAPEEKAYAVTDVRKPAVDDGDEAGEERAEKRRPCPMCGEMILRKAAKCRYCGEIFDKTLAISEGRSKDGGDMTTGDWVVAIICSGIGCIAGIVWMIQGKRKGTKMFLVSLGMVIFWSAVRFVLELASEGR